MPATSFDASWMSFLRSANACLEPKITLAFSKACCFCVLGGDSGSESTGSVGVIGCAWESCFFKISENC